MIQIFIAIFFNHPREKTSSITTWPFTIKVIRHWHSTKLSTSRMNRKNSIRVQITQNVDFSIIFQFPTPPPKEINFEEFIWLSKFESRGLKSEKGGAEISRGGTTWKLIRKGSENNIRQEGFGSMDQNRSTFSTANIGRWQSTFTNGSASHGFKKEKKEVGKEKRRVTIMKGCVTEKAATEKTKRFKGRKL